MSHGGRVEIEEAHQDFADNARANSVPRDALVVLCIAAVAEPAGSAKGVQERFVCCERWKIGKESSVRA
jgi:hypothetical protein